jgi:hypothetical protein
MAVLTHNGSGALSFELNGLNSARSSTRQPSEWA